MKTREELNALKKEAEALNGKLRELTDEELAQVVGGGTIQDVSSNTVKEHGSQMTGRLVNRYTLFADVPKQEKEIHIYENTLDGFDPPNY